MKIKNLSETVILFLTFFVVLFILLMSLLFIAFFFYRCGNLVGFDVYCGRMYSWEFEEYALRGKNSFSAGWFESSTNVNFHSIF